MRALRTGINVAKAQMRMQGLRWVIDMYRMGVCGDYRFVYERFPPTVDGLLDELTSGASCTEPLTPAALIAGQQACSIDSHELHEYRDSLMSSTLQLGHR